MNFLSLKNPFLALWLSEKQEKEGYKLFHDDVVRIAPRAARQVEKERARLLRSREEVEEAAEKSKFDLKFNAMINEIRLKSRGNVGYRLFMDNKYTFYSTKAAIADELFKKGYTGGSSTYHFDKLFSDDLKLGHDVSIDKDKDVRIMMFDKDYKVRYKTSGPEEKRRLLSATFVMGGRTLFAEDIKTPTSSPTTLTLLAPESPTVTVEEVSPTVTVEEVSPGKEEVD